MNVCRRMEHDFRCVEAWWWATRGAGNENKENCTHLMIPPHETYACMRGLP